MFEIALHFELVGDFAVPLLFAAAEFGAHALLGKVGDVRDHSRHAQASGRRIVVGIVPSPPLGI